MQSLNTAIPAVPRKGLGSADCDSIYTIYISLCTQTADPIPFRGTHCTIPAASMIHTESKPVLWYLINILYVYIFFFTHILCHSQFCIDQLIYLWPLELPLYSINDILHYSGGKGLI